MKDLAVQEISGDSVTIAGGVIERLANCVQGDVLTQEHADYDEARRVFNAMIDKRPALIVRCVSDTDVVEAVNFVRSHGLLCAVRGGGHSIGGKSVCDGGALIDLSPLKGIRVDPVHLVARAEPGLRLGEFDRETQGFGLATTTGIVSDTGLAGLTLGGGIGWLNGRCGLACDNVLSMDVVTVDGQLRRANADENPDLFWGLRGGSGNLGIVTAFEYQLHRVGPVLGGMLIYPQRQAHEVLRFYDDFSRDAPDELSTAAGFLPYANGETLIGIVVCHCGRLEEGERVLKPFRSMGAPISDTIKPIPYVEMQSLLDGAFPPGRQHYWKSHLVRAPLSDDAIEIVVQFAAARPSPLSAVVLQQMHGAASQPGPSDTAFAHRYEQYDLLLLSQWEEPADEEKNIAWTREFWVAMQPFGKGVYVNNLGEEGDDIIRDAYGVNYARLAAIKNKYDPTNFLRLNQNIAPSR